MIKRMIQRWLGIAHEVDTYESELRDRSYLGSALNETSSTVTAHKITNGYIVRTVDKSFINKTMALPQFTYCKDHQAIADHIVAESARQSLGVNHQYELFDGPTASGQIVGGRIR